MAVVSRGFGARRREQDPALPPGQYLTTDFPVLSAGPTPHLHAGEWELEVRTETGARRTWSWEELLALPQEDVRTDIHCVTRWSKLGTRWRGVAVDTLLEGVETTAAFTTVHCYGGYTTNVPLADLVDGKAWIATEFEGAPLPDEHGGPARLLVPHLYFWKSAKWVRGLVLTETDEPGFWERNGYHLYGDPWREQRYW
ncbi:sulfite oxidase-like oxidoreductase [Cellulomonas endophytica]|uniref:sulfite oxidase-like oxidoreductase n=1 Tax=Cellulomonas endophytica TaxID=2494735 RepID=UPI001011DF21|nr:sulfite oxidase-like oxidoreductase [Cellulomonas endophytica]